MWLIKDFFINFLLKIRLFLFLSFNSKRFSNINNKIEKKGWDLTFQDEFDEKKLNKKKWRTDNYYGLRYHPGNIIEKNEAPSYYCGDNMFEFTETTLKQKAEKKDTKINHTDWDGKNYGNYTIPYKIGQIDSSKSFQQKYGYFEIRSKITSEPGHWPAFWLASKESWPPEIDIYEIYTGKKRNGLVNFESNFHWGKDKDKKMKVGSHNVANVSKKFHTYAVEWNEKCFKIYYDNLLVRIFSNPKALEFFKYPMHIIIGNQIDPTIGRGLEKVKFPTYHEIDYVRVYKKS